MTERDEKERELLQRKSEMREIKENMIKKAPKKDDEREREKREMRGKRCT